jgi:hypothetical protein
MGLTPAFTDVSCRLLVRRACDPIRKEAPPEKPAAKRIDASIQDEKRRMDLCKDERSS